MPLGACMEKVMALAPPLETAAPCDEESIAARRWFCLLPPSSPPPLRRETGRVPVEAVRIEYEGLGSRLRWRSAGAGPPAPPLAPPFPSNSTMDFDELCFFSHFSRVFFPLEKRRGRRRESKACELLSLLAPMLPSAATSARGAPCAASTSGRGATALAPSGGNSAATRCRQHRCRRRCSFVSLALASPTRGASSSPVPSNGSSGSMPSPISAGEKRATRASAVSMSDAVSR